MVNMVKSPEQNEIETLINRLVEDKFYGALEIKLESGRIVLIKKTETLKPTTNNFRANRGMHDSRRNIS